MFKFLLKPFALLVVGLSLAGCYDADASVEYLLYTPQGDSIKCKHFRYTGNGPYCYWDKRVKFDMTQPLIIERKIAAQGVYGPLMTQ